MLSPAAPTAKPLVDGTITSCNTLMQCVRCRSSICFACVNDFRQTRAPSRSRPPARILHRHRRFHRQVTCPDVTGVGVGDKEYATTQFHTVSPTPVLRCRIRVALPFEPAPESCNRMLLYSRRRLSPRQRRVLSSVW